MKHNAMRVGRWLVITLALAGGFASAQTVTGNGTKEFEQQTLTVSGNCLTFQDALGGVSGSFEILVNGAPLTLSTTVNGVMRGGTTTALGNNSSTANSVISTTGGPYDKYTVCATWTGGTSPSIVVNRTSTIARKPQTGTLPNGTVAYGLTYTGPATGGVSATVGPVANPLLPGLTGYSDVCNGWETLIAANTNGVSGDVVNLLGALSTNNTPCAYNMFPPNAPAVGSPVAGFEVWLPAGQISPTVPQTIGTISSIARGTGRGGLTGTGSTAFVAGNSFPKTGIGTAPTIACPGGITGASGGYAAGSCSGGFTISGGTGWYYYPVVVFTGGGCTTEPAQVLKATNGVLTAIQDAPYGTNSGTPNARGTGCASVPSATVYPGVQGSPGTVNMTTGVGPNMSPWVMGVGTMGAYNEDTQLWDMSVDPGTTATTGGLATF